MKKKIILSILAITVIIFGCKKEEEAKTIAVKNIVLNETNIKLTEKQIFVLKANILPSNATNKSIKWTSSDENIAIVGVKGMITAISPGQAEITAESEDGGKVASCIVDVLKPKIKTLTLDITEKVFYMDENPNHTLIPIVTPEGADISGLIWASENNDIATVDQEGNVKVIAPGETYISVSTKDKSKTAKCRIIVNKARIHVDKIIISSTSEKYPSNAKFTLTYKVIPENADNKAVSWSSSNSNIATVDNYGNVTTKSDGVATISVVTQDGNKIASCIVTVDGVARVKFTTSISPGGMISLGINAAKDDQKNVWIDLNDNGKRDPGEDVSVFGQWSDAVKKYVINSHNITIYGNLTRLACNKNEVTSIDLTALLDLNRLEINDNKITEIDLSHNSNLRDLVIAGNSNLSSLDVSNLKNLTNITGHALGVSEIKGLTNLKVLKTLRLDGSSVVKLDLSGNNSLTDLLAANSRLSSVIGLTKKANLKTVDVSSKNGSNAIIELDLSDNPALKTVNLMNNKFSAANLNKIFNQLPKASGTITITGNPGSDEANAEIALSKGWKINK